MGCAHPSEIERAQRLDIECAQRADTLQSGLRIGKPDRRDKSLGFRLSLSRLSGFSPVLGFDPLELSLKEAKSRVPRRKLAIQA